jgi:hypothetical protein
MITVLDVTPYSFLDIAVPEGLLSQSTSTLTMEAKLLRNADISQTTRRHVPQNCSLHIHRRDNVKSQKKLFCLLPT